MGYYPNRSGSVITRPGARARLSVVVAVALPAIVGLQNLSAATLSITLYTARRRVYQLRPRRCAPQVTACRK